MPELSTAERLAALRIIDANFNRASEGLRVIEEFVRFARNDRHLVEELKSLRHTLMQAMQAIDFRELLTARDTENDPGTTVSLASETSRANFDEVVRANFQRLQQALRSIEEYGKTLSSILAATVEQIRYRTYTLEKALLPWDTKREALQKSRLYVLIDGKNSAIEFRDSVAELISAGAHVLQLRDKQLDDRTLLARAKALREETRGTNTLCIVNDRPDIATLAEADGVHVGQEELSVADVRKIVGPKMMVGISTHNIEQAKQAVLDGADYIGCGPTFPSSTKSFEQFPGLEFLQEVAAEISLPAFAIGGITQANLPEVLATGFTRVAVSGAVTNATNPNLAVQELLRLLVQ